MLTPYVLNYGLAIETQQQHLADLGSYTDISLSQVVLYSTYYGMPYDVTTFNHEKIRQKMRLPKVEFIQ
jgi:hypothetical protein